MIGTTSTTNSIPLFTGSSSSTSWAGSSSSIIYTTGTGNIGIGTAGTTTNSRMTINTNGSVTLGNINPSHNFDMQTEKIKELKIQFMDLLVESISQGGLINGLFMNEMIEVFDTCGGWNVDTVDDFKKIEELTRGKKIPRKIVSRLNDIIADRIINTWGFDLHDAGEIFEKIDLD
jgi:hypothetical protein